METYALALMIAIPAFSVLVLIEVAYGHFTGQQSHYALDTISSLSSGITNTIKDSLGVVLIILSYPFLLHYLSVFEIENTLATYLVGFVAIDFASYWNHRLSHKVNFFWNRHVIHHSSEEFNLACALRQTISNFIGIYPIFLIPAAIAGVPAQVIATIAPIHLFMQFWYHTRHVPKLGWLEYIIVTPSQHRVHHAINDIYIDKNLAAIFCLWDRMFGTFQEELDEVPPVYGVLKPAKTWNPIRINFQHLRVLIIDAWNTKSWKAKLLIWFKPSGWRPEDVREQYSFDKIEDVYGYQKFRSQASRSFIAWSSMHLGVTVLLLMHMLSQFGDLQQRQLWLYCGIIFFGIYGYTSLMDRDRYAVWLETARGLAGIAIIALQGSWFGLSGLITGGDMIAAGYFAATIAGAIYFTYFESQEEESSAAETGDLPTAASS